MPSHETASGPICTTCGGRRQASATSGKCPSCDRERVLDYQKRNPEVVRATGQRYYARNKEAIQGRIRARKERLKADPAAWIVAQKKPVARYEGIPFELEPSDIIVPEFCPVLGIRLAPVGSGDRDAVPSLDRLDSSKGYVRGNVHVISNRANTLKGNGTAEEHEKIAAWMKSQAGR